MAAPLAVDALLPVSLVAVAVGARVAARVGVGAATHKGGRGGGGGGGILEAPPPKGPAAEADDRPVVPEVVLPGLGRGATDVADLEVDLGAGVVRQRRQRRQVPPGRIHPRYGTQETPHSTTSPRPLRPRSVSHPTHNTTKPIDPSLELQSIKSTARLPVPVGVVVHLLRGTAVRNTHTILRFYNL